MNPDKYYVNTREDGMYSVTRNGTEIKRFAFKLDAEEYARDMNDELPVRTGDDLINSTREGLIGNLIAQGDELWEVREANSLGMKWYTLHNPAGVAVANFTDPELAIDMARKYYGRQGRKPTQPEPECVYTSPYCKIIKVEYTADDGIKSWYYRAISNNGEDSVEDNCLSRLREKADNFFKWLENTKKEKSSNAGKPKDYHKEAYFPAGAEELFKDKTTPPTPAPPRSHLERTVNEIIEIEGFKAIVTERQVFMPDFEYNKSLQDKGIEYNPEDPSTWYRLKKI